MTEPQAEETRLTVGLQPVREAIRVHGSKVAEVLIADRAGDPQRLDAIERFARDQGVRRVARVPSRELDRVSGGVAHQGTAAWVPPLKLVGIDTIAAQPAGLVVALDGIQDPQNFGAVIRSAVGVAEATVLWPENASAPLSLATFRASAGAIEHALLCRVPSLPDALGELAASAYAVIGLDGQAPIRLADVDLTGPTVVVVGSEHRGMRRATRRACTAFASVTSTRRIDSLNASVAAAIAMYEAANQRAKTST